jgi:hypothetical protein
MYLCIAGMFCRIMGRAQIISVFVTAAIQSADLYCVDPLCSIYVV